MATPLDITRLTEADALADIDALIALLTDTVDHGASVGFLRPMDAAIARAYWDEVIDGVARGSKVLLAGRMDDRLVGSVQLEFAGRPNGRHRAEVQKLIVATSHRRRGIAKQLMQVIEREAVVAGRWLLVLDTELGSGAAPLYEALGWQRVGSIPSFATNTDGVPTPNVIYFKKI